MSKLTCPECQAEITVRKDGLLRVHYLPDGNPCPGGAEPEPRSIEQKARRYLAQARVKVARVARGDCEVLVHGSKDEPYRVRLAGDVWSCTCEARTWRCAHVVAGMLVVPDGMATEPRFGSDSPLDALLSESVADGHVEDEDWADFMARAEEDAAWLGRT